MGLWNGSLDPCGQKSPSFGAIRENVSGRGACGTQKRSIFETVWRSNAERRQRRDKPCEEVEPRQERIEPEARCASKSLLMGHGGPLIPVWLFVSLPVAVNTGKVVLSDPDYIFISKTKTVFSAGIFTR